MKTKLWFGRLYILAAACLIGAFCASQYPEWKWTVRAHAAEAQAFYLERAEYERNQDGVLSMYNLHVIARSVDGRTAIVDHSALDKVPAGVRFPPTRKVIMPDGTAVWLLDDLRLKSSWPKMTSSDARAELELMANHDVSCGKNSPIAREYLKGHPVLAAVSDPDETRQFKVWASPEFGCETLESNETLKGDGSVLVEARLVKAELGEPDARLFDLGEKYQEVSMIDLLAAQLRAIGQTMSPDVRRMAANLERERKQTVPEGHPMIPR